MRKSWQTVAFASAFAATVLAATALYADSTQNKSRSMMGHGGMMGQMGQMGEMMQGCSRMMQGMMGGAPAKPNDQWRQQAPSAPEKKS
jgi:hypothetical protein